MQVTSVVAGGTAFRIYLPRTDAPTNSGIHRTYASRPGTDTILVVEDEPAVRTRVKAVLEKRGYSVLAVLVTIRVVRSARFFSIVLESPESFLPPGGERCAPMRDARRGKRV